MYRLSFSSHECSPSPLTLFCPASYRAVGLCVFLIFLVMGKSGLCQTSFGFVNNITSVPIPGVGHDYIHDLNEIVNPANGSLSVRIEAPRPKERAFNYPLYSFMYDSTQQFFIQYSVTYTGISYSCGPDTAGDEPYGEPPQPINCISEVSFFNQSPFYPSQIQGVLSGPNSILSSYQYAYSRFYAAGQYKTCDVYQGYSYEDPYGVTHNLGVYSIIQGELENNNSCQYMGVYDNPIGGDEQYKIVVENPYTLTFPSENTLVPGIGYMIDIHGNAVQVPTNGPAAALTMEDTNGNAISSTGRTGSYQSFQPWGDSYNKTPSRTFPGGATYNYTWGTAATQYTPNSVDETIGVNGWDHLCTAPVLGPQGSTSNRVVTKMQEPDGLYYTFFYDPTYGFLDRITYPTGAWVQYTWGVNSMSDATGFKTPPAVVGNYNDYTDPIHVAPGYEMNTWCMFEHDTPAITKRVVSYDGVHSALEQDFSYSTVWSDAAQGWWTSKQTIVTTKDLLSPGTPSFKTIYNYSYWPAYQSIGSHLISSGQPLESSIIYQDTNGTVLKTVTKAWNSTLQLAGECTTLPNGKTSGTFYQYEPYALSGQNGSLGAPGSASTNSPTDVAEYDYGLVTTPCQRPTTTPTRETVTTYASFSNTPIWPTFTELNGNSQVPISMPPIADRPATIVKYQSGTKISETDYSYDQTAVASVSPTPYGHDETNYGNSAPTVARGNPTTITRQCFQGSTNCTNSVTTVAYDTTGQPVSVTDANGNQTTLSYSDNYTTDDGTPPGNTNTYITKITWPTTNGVPHVESFQWDFDKGELRTLTDENGNPTSYQYLDPWWRLTQANFPDGGQITKTYVDAGPNPSVTTNTLISSSVTMTSETVMDAAGHVTQTQLSTDPDGTDYVSTTYDGLGRVASVTNPYRTTSDPTYGGTSYLYDSLNRKTIQTQPDGSVIQWCYNNIASSGQTNCTANASTQTNDEWIDFSDEIGNHWQRTFDALGRMTAVMEPNGLTPSPSMETDYGYDGLDDLLSVVQNGNNSSNARTRSFLYDSMGRLTSATNPESGTLTYGYDANGNLTSKVGPEANQTGTSQTTTNYAYDQLNRLTKKSYVDPTKGTDIYGYDGVAVTGCPGPTPPTISQPTNLIGRRSAMCSGNSASAWSFDPMGRPAIEARTNKGTSAKQYNIYYMYYYDGSLKTITYPSGNLLTYLVKGAQRSTQVSDSANTYITTPPNWPNPPMYTANGALANASEGSGIVVNNIFNNRLQPTLLSAVNNQESSIFSLCYDFHSGVSISQAACKFSAYATGNNGNLFQVLNNVDSTRSAAFSYDTLNRIAQAKTINTTSPNCWGEVYTIDAWGNLTNRSGPSGMGGCYTEGLNDAPASTSNQLPGLKYDAAGNVTNDGNGNTPTYDTENRIATDAGYTYSYDGDGQRMEKADGSSGTMFWYGPSGEVLTETSLTGTINEEYVYVNGQRIARVDRPSGTSHYYFSDNLNSASVITDPIGTIVQATFYYPYGGMESSSGSDPNNYKFTGKERDTESGLDNFGARYNASTMGRFMTPDWSAKPQGVPYAVLDDPQSLNLYAYARNNPTTFYDPDGHCWKWAQFFCNAGQSFNNLFHGLGFNTNARVDALVKQGRANLRQHGFSTEGLSRAAVMGAARTGKTFQTYLKRHPNLEPYSGRTSGYGTPEENVQARDVNHHMNEKGYGEAELDKSSPNSDAIRGREQMNIEANGGAQSQGGTSGNAINGISDKNPNKPGYMNAAEEEFGPVEAAGAAEGAEGAEGAEEVIEVIEILNDIPE